MTSSKVVVPNHNGHQRKHDKKESTQSVDNTPVKTKPVWSSKPSICWNFWRGECAQPCLRLHVELPHHSCRDCCIFYTVNKCKYEHSVLGCKSEHHKKCRDRTQLILKNFNVDPENILRSPPPEQPTTPPRLLLPRGGRPLQERDASRFEGARAFVQTPKRKAALASQELEDSHEQAPNSRAMVPPAAPIANENPRESGH